MTITTNANHPTLSPPSPSSITLKLLGLTIGFAMAGALLALAPTLGYVRQNWLQSHLQSAHIAVLPLKARPGDAIADALRDEILEDAELFSVAVKGGSARRLLIAADNIPPISHIVYLQEEDALAHIWAALATLLQGAGAAEGILVIDAPNGAEGDVMEVILDEMALRDALIDYAYLIFAIALAISSFWGSLLFMSARHMLVRPLRRLAANMTFFSEAPEDGGRILRPRLRQDEVGDVERALADLQSRVHLSLNHKSRLAALGVAVSKLHHDLRNILASVELLSHHLSESSDPTVKRVAPRLLTAVHRASSLCTQTLEYGRLETRLPLMERVMLRQLTEEVGGAVSLPKGGKVRWVNEVPPDLYIYGDSQHIFRILLNLGRNAVEAMAASGQEGGRVTVSAERRGAEALLWVEDTGPGIPDAMRENLFEPFASGSRGARARGTFGLGLAISSELARALGGDLSLMEGGTEGARFRLRLPLRYEERRILPFSKTA